MKISETWLKSTVSIVYKVFRLSSSSLKFWKFWLSMGGSLSMPKSISDRSSPLPLARDPKTKSLVVERLKYFLAMFRISALNWSIG